MKRRLLILSVLAICAATLAAGTLAYFNSEDTAHNVITTGGVEIAIQEWADEERETEFTDPDGVMPGAEITKIAEVKNVGASDAWVRVKVTKAVNRADQGEADLDLIQLDLNTKDWTLGEDGYYYYNVALKAGEVTEPIFTCVKFDKNMGNDYQEAEALVDVYAQAVQSANNGESALEAFGWPDEPHK